ncbi:C-type lectin domain family 4 member E-like [Mustelus asterias]
MEGESEGGRERETEGDRQTQRMEPDGVYINTRGKNKDRTTPRADEFGQETAGGRCSITSTHLGRIALIVLIISLAIAIGLRVQEHQMRKDLLLELDGKFQNASEIARSLCRLLRNRSDSLCPSGWKLHNHSCYRFSIAKGNWDTAKRECESLNSHLLIINTDQEQNFAIKSMPNKNKQYFIGLTDRESEGNWKWVDGTPVSKSHWLKNQPDNWNGDEHCGTISKVDVEDVFGWNDVPCSMEFPFICEKLAPSSIGAAAFEKYCP